MDNIFERLMITLSAVVFLLAAYYFFIDSKPISTKNPVEQSVNIDQSEPELPADTDTESQTAGKKRVYNEYYDNPDYRRSDVVLDDYVPTDEDIEEYNKYKEGL